MYYEVIRAKFDHEVECLSHANLSHHYFMKLLISTIRMMYRASEKPVKQIKQIKVMSGRHGTSTPTEISHF